MKAHGNLFDLFTVDGFFYWSYNDINESPYGYTSISEIVSNFYFYYEANKAN